MKLGILYSACGSVAILSVIVMIVLLVIDTYGEQPPLISIIVRVIIGSVIGIGAISNGVNRIRAGKEEKHNA